MQPSMRYVDGADGPLHVVDFGGSGPPIVLVHGLGGCYANWAPISGALRHHGHVTAIDLPGFGLTPPRGRPCTVPAIRAALHGYLGTLGEPATLVGNSMGATIALLQAAAAPSTVASLVLISPAVPLASLAHLDPVVAGLFSLYLLPGAARLVMRGRRRFQTPEEAAMFTLDLCSARVGRILPSVVADHIDVAQQRLDIDGVDDAFIRALRSLLGLMARKGRFDQQMAAVAAPTLVIHGDSDRLVPLQSTLRLSGLRPDWRLEVLEDVGHIPMLEIPVTVGRLIEDWTKWDVAA